MSFVTAIAKSICTETISLINQYPQIYNKLPSLNNSSCTNFEDPQQVYSLINSAASTIAIVGGLIALCLNSTNYVKVNSLLTKTTFSCTVIAQISIACMYYYSNISNEEPCFE